MDASLEKAISKRLYCTKDVIESRLKMRRATARGNRPFPFCGKDSVAVSFTRSRWRRPAPELSPPCRRLQPREVA